MTFFSLGNQLGACVKKFFFHVVMDFIKEFRILIEIVNLIEENKLELFPGIHVFDGLLLHPDEDVWETVAKVVKSLFAETSHGAVIAAFDGSRSQTLCEKRDFTEIFSLL